MLVYAVCRASIKFLRETASGQVLSSFVLLLIEEPLTNMNSGKVKTPSCEPLHKIGPLTLINIP